MSSGYNYNQASGYRPPPQQGGGGYGAPPPNYGAAPPPQGYYGQQGPPPQSYQSPPPQHQQAVARPPPPHSGLAGAPPHSGHAGPTGGAPPQPPPGADPQLYYWFQAVDTDKSGALTTEELQRVLINGDWSPFNIETVRLMMNMFDTDNTGTITFNEFAGLWRYIEDWKKCFQTFDADNSGTINFTELKTALTTFGYNLSDNFINLLIKKYDKYGKGDVTFDNFVQSCVTIKTLTDAFRRYDTDNDGWILINYEQFLELVVTNR